MSRDVLAPGEGRRVLHVRRRRRRRGVGRGREAGGSRRERGLRRDRDRRHSSAIEQAYFIHSDDEAEDGRAEEAGDVPLVGSHHVAVGGANGELVVLEDRTLRVVSARMGPTRGGPRLGRDPRRGASVEDLKYSPDDASLAASTRDGAVATLAVGGGNFEVPRSTPYGSRLVFAGHGAAAAKHLDWTSDGSCLGSSGADYELLHWDPGGGSREPDPCDAGLAVGDVDAPAGFPRDGHLGAGERRHGRQRRRPVAGRAVPRHRRRPRRGETVRQPVLRRGRGVSEREGARESRALGEVQRGRAQGRHRGGEGPVRVPVPTRQGRRARAEARDARRSDSSRSTREEELRVQDARAENQRGRGRRPAERRREKKGGGEEGAADARDAETERLSDAATVDAETVDAETNDAETNDAETNDAAPPSPGEDEEVVEGEEVALETFDAETIETIDASPPSPGEASASDAETVEEEDVAKAVAVAPEATTPPPGENATPPPESAEAPPKAEASAPPESAEANAPPSPPSDVAEDLGFSRSVAARRTRTTSRRAPTRGTATISNGDRATKSARRRGRRGASSID